MVRVILQLATKFLTHEDTLPFWAGILDCARGPRQEVARFHVHPRQRLCEARKTETLEQLKGFADEIRIHFREFGEEDGAEGTSNGFANNMFVSAKDPDFDPATYFDLTCNHLSLSACDCHKGAVYAFRDGKPVVEDSRFQHIFMNTRPIMGFNMRSSQWRGLSIWDLQTSIFNTASVLCHELAHAFMLYHVGRDAYMNDESISETGFSWETSYSVASYSHVVKVHRQSSCHGLTCKCLSSTRQDLLGWASDTLANSSTHAS